MNKTNRLLIIFCILTILSPLQSFSQSQAPKGTTIWSEGGAITYEYDYLVEWHSNFLNNPLLNIKNYNLVDEQYKITYVGLYEDNMLFKKDTKSDLLSEALGLSFTSAAEDLVDPTTGLEKKNDNWAGYFYDTADLKIGMQLNDIVFPFSYEDSTGSKSINKKFSVLSEDILNIKIDSSSLMQVPVWKLVVPDFEIKYTDLLSNNYVEFVYSFKDISYSISQNNGVVVAFSQEISWLADTQQILKETVNATAIEANNVAIDKQSTATSPSFELYIMFGTLLVIVLKKKRF